MSVCIGWDQYDDGESVRVSVRVSVRESVRESVRVNGCADGDVHARAYDDCSNLILSS